MNQKNYKEKFSQLINDLQENKFIELIDASIGGPTLDIVFNSVLKVQNLKVFNEISELYHQMDSCKIEWVCQLNKHPEILKFADDDTDINGLIVIRPIEIFLSFDQKLNDEAWQKNLAPEEKQQLPGFRYFDFNDDYIRAGYIIDENRIIEDEMFFILQNSDGFSPAGIKFNDYIDKYFQYKGYQGWQYNYFFQKSDNFKRMKFYIDQIF